MNYLSNAFSLSMLPNPNSFVITTLCTENDIPNDFESFIGHQDLANIISDLLNLEVNVNRNSLKLNFGDVLYVAQYIGPRLPEGTQTLPNNATIQFYKIMCASTVMVGYEFSMTPITAQNDIERVIETDRPVLHFFDL